jgi:copper ion binding protein
MGKTISIEGMTCGHCAARVTKALQAVNGVKGVDVSLERKNAVLEGDGLVDADIRAAIEDAGYQVTKIG